MWPDLFGTLDFHLAQHQQKRESELNTTELLENAEKTMRGLSVQERCRYL